MKGKEMLFFSFLFEDTREFLFCLILYLNHI